jgi:hypothetical protein
MCEEEVCPITMCYHSIHLEQRKKRSWSPVWIQKLPPEYKWDSFIDSFLFYPVDQTTLILDMSIYIIIEILIKNMAYSVHLLNSSQYYRILHWGNLLLNSSIA